MSPCHTRLEGESEGRAKGLGHQAISFLPPPVPLLPRPLLLSRLSHLAFHCRYHSLMCISYTCKVLSAVSCSAYSSIHTLTARIRQIGCKIRRLFPATHPLWQHLCDSVVQPVNHYRGSTKVETRLKGVVRDTMYHPTEKQIW